MTVIVRLWMYTVAPGALRLWLPDCGLVAVPLRLESDRGRVELRRDHVSW